MFVNIINHWSSTNWCIHPILLHWISPRLRRFDILLQKQELHWLFKQFHSQRETLSKGRGGIVWKNHAARESKYTALLTVWHADTMALGQSETQDTVADGCGNRSSVFVGSLNTDYWEVWVTERYRRGHENNNIATNFRSIIFRPST